MRDRETKEAPARASEKKQKENKTRVREITNTGWD